MVSQPKFFNAVCRQYANILKDLPKKVAEDLKAFLDWSKEKYFLWGIFKDSQIPTQLQKNLSNLFFENFSSHQMTRKVLFVLIDHYRLGFLPDILDCLTEMQNPNKSIYLTISKRLAPKNLSQLSQQLTKFLNNKISIHQMEDKNLLLGGILVWDCLMLDASLASLLQTLKNETLYAISNT